MKNKRFSKLAALLLAISLLVCATVGTMVTANAEEEATLKIGNVNLYVYDTFSLVVTVDYTGSTVGTKGIAVYDGAGYDANAFDPAAATAIYTTTETITVGTVAAYMTQEIAANFMSYPFVIVPIIVDENGDVLEYGEEKLWSVTKYAGAKLYEADEANSDEDDTNDVSEVKIKFYNALLNYAAAADTLLDGEGDSRLYFEAATPDSGAGEGEAE